MGDEADKRVELVEAGRSRAGLPGYIGVGMLGGIILGFGPLRDAVQGHGSFEDAMVRFMASLLVCLVSASVIGRLLDAAPPEEGEAGEQGESAVGGGDGAEIGPQHS